MIKYLGLAFVNYLPKSINIFPVVKIYMADNHYGFLTKRALKLKYTAYSRCWYVNERLV